MIDYTLIYRTFISIAEDVVGSQISTTGSRPSVIRSRQTGDKTSTGPTPDYPYVTVDILATRRPSGRIIRQTMLDDNTHRYEVVKELLINYTVFGGDSRAVAESLESSFITDQILERVRDETDGQVRSTEDILEIPKLLSTSYNESSSFNLTFSITDIIDVAGVSIDEVQYTGDLFRSTEDVDPLPLEGTVN